MKRILMTALAAAMTVAAAPSFAQGAGGMKSGQMEMDSMTCEQMMEKGHTSMDGISSGKKKTMMMKEMDMAKMSMSSGKEDDCKMHMKKAMMGM